MRLVLVALIALIVLAPPVATRADALRFTADDWLTECASVRPTTDCSLTAAVRGFDPRGLTGSFAIVVGLDSLLVAIVGQPFPAKAILRVDRYPPHECIGARHCLFTKMDSAKLISELAVGKLLLLDVHAGKQDFRSSLSIKGYQAGIAKIGAVSEYHR